jgi:hypothetical protein
LLSFYLSRSFLRLLCSFSHLPHFASRRTTNGSTQTQARSETQMTYSCDDVNCEWLCRAWEITQTSSRIHNYGKILSGISNSELRVRTENVVA